MGEEFVAILVRVDTFFFFKALHFLLYFEIAWIISILW